jgi:hypothetical protein
MMEYEIPHDCVELAHLERESFCCGLTEVDTWVATSSFFNHCFREIDPYWDRAPVSDGGRYETRPGPKVEDSSAGGYSNRIEQWRDRLAHEGSKSIHVPFCAP